MPLYELGFIVAPELAPDDENGALERIEKIITDADGEITERESWGRRRLAYQIEDHTQGVYHFWKFEAAPTTIEPLEFALRTDDRFIRHLVLNLDRELRRSRKRERTEAIKAAKKARKAQEAAVAEGDEG